MTQTIAAAVQEPKPLRRCSGRGVGSLSMSCLVSETRDCLLGLCEAGRPSRLAPERLGVNEGRAALYNIRVLVEYVGGETCVERECAEDVK
jgi:hypothetical protein